MGKRSRTSSSLYVAVEKAGLGFVDWWRSAPREGLQLYGRIGKNHDPMEWIMTGVGDDKPRHSVDKDRKRRYRGKVQWQNANREYA